MHETRLLIKVYQEMHMYRTCVLEWPLDLRAILRLRVAAFELKSPSQMPLAGGVPRSEHARGRREISPAPRADAAPESCSACVASRIEHLTKTACRQRRDEVKVAQQRQGKRFVLIVERWRMGRLGRL